MASFKAALNFSRSIADPQIFDLRGGTYSRTWRKA
jgi:hypothetical protein